MKALFDTNILVDYLKGVEEARLELERYNQRLISVVTWMELLAGGRDDAETDVLDMFLGDFRVVDLSRKIARNAAAIRQVHRVRLPDAIIWATAQAESALLIPRNTKDFPADAPGVRVPYQDVSPTDAPHATPHMSRSPRGSGFSVHAHTGG